MAPLPENANVGHRPCGRCGAWPDDFYVVQGDNRHGRRVSFGHKESLTEAEQQLADESKANPDLTHWSIMRMQPATMIEVVATLRTEEVAT